MARVLITSGPTRQYLDPVRFLSNASSGRMGRALAAAALEAGHQVTVVSGPVEVDYPSAADVVPVITTEEMLSACQRVFADCDGLVGAAAPCDYRPITVADHKMRKTGQPLDLRLEETADVVATLAGAKGHRWVVGFALETEDQRFRALAKLERKCCDLIVANGPDAMNALGTQVEIFDRLGETVKRLAGSKEDVASEIWTVIENRLIKKGISPIT